MAGGRWGQRAEARRSRRELIAMTLAIALAGCGGGGTEPTATRNRRRHRAGQPSKPERGRILRAAGPVTAANAARVEELGAIRVSSAELVDLGYMPGGQTVACGDDFGVLRLADTRTGNAKTLFHGGSCSWGVAVRPDGAIAWGDDSGALRLLRPTARTSSRLAAASGGVFDLA
jgi:hypothetical protein